MTGQSTRSLASAPNMKGGTHEEGTEFATRLNSILPLQGDTPYTQVRYLYMVIRLII